MDNTFINQCRQEKSELLVWCIEPPWLIQNDKILIRSFNKNQRGSLEEKWMGKFLEENG